MAAGPRVIIVEDEALIAMMMDDMLTDLGCQVVGSFGGVTEAMSWLDRSEPIDGALLDVNIGGEMVFPVAEALIARKVPFAFATGYGALATDRFAEVALLEKPIGPNQLTSVVASFGA